MKKMVIIFAGLAVIGLTFAGLFIFMKKQMAKIPSMTAKECLDYTLKDKEDAIITIGIIKDGHTSWDVYGKDGKKISSKLHTYEIGSLTKTITATLICKAADEGKICIDDTIDKYLDLPQDKEYPTIADLLTHTSGYKEYYLESPMVKNFFTGKNSFYGISDEMFLKRIARVDVSKADKSWRYSNFGFATLGQILEAVYDCEYTGMANEFLLEQGMGNSHISTGDGDLGKYWDWEKDDAYIPAGAVVSDIEDMLIYAGHQFDEDGLFSKMHNSLKEVNATPSDWEQMDIHVDAMGMGWIIDETNGIIWHNGGTGDYNCYVGFCPETKTAVVVLSNLSPGYKIPSTVIGIKKFKEIK